MRPKALRWMWCLNLALALGTVPGAAAARAEDAPYAPWPHFSTIGEGAIPRGVVASLAQDRAGHLWVATGDGLVRYDGYRFRPQERESADPARRNLGWVRAMLPAQDGRLWIASESDGLAVYDPATDRIGDAIPGGRGPTAITALAEDTAGAVWIASADAGLDRLRPGEARLTHFGHHGQDGDLPDDRLRALLVDRQGDLWVGSWRGLSRKARGSNRFEPVQQGAAGLAGRTVQALYEASDGKIWVGTQQGELVSIDPQNLQAELLPAPPWARRGPASPVSSLVEAPDGVMWVGRSTGIDLYGLAERQWQRRLQHDPRQHAGLAGNEVSSLLRDRAGAIWVGGYGLGLQRHDPNNRAIWVRDPDPGAASLFRDADVRSLLVLANGDTWVATHSGEVAVLNRQLQAVARLQPAARGAAPAGTGPLPVLAMAQDRQGMVWLGGDATVLQYSADRQWRRALAHDGGATHRLLAGRDGRLWVATQAGLFVLHPGEAALRRVALASGGAFKAEVFALAEAGDGGLWVGTAKGLWRVAPRGSVLQEVPAAADATLGHPVVIGLLVDRQQNLWVDTAMSGLHRLRAWDGSRASFERISARHGIYNKPFGVNLLEDSGGRIWTHMHVYEPAQDRLTVLSAADGVAFGTGWFRAYAQMADGRLLFGGSKGLLVVEPGLYDVSAYSPPLVVSELRINGEVQHADLARQGLTLTAEQRRFSLEFAALDYSDPNRNRYAYQLEGVDADWVETGAESRVASYGNLAPGAYQLRVRATNRSGVWSPRELAIPVRVLPAWWQQWWFKALLVAGLALLLFATVQWRTRRLRASRQALELTVRSRTADLEEMANALRQESAALAESSLTDPLTGMRNRRFVSQHIEADVALALRRYATAAAAQAAAPNDADLIFFLVDIDQFKQVNDQHGHAAGDAVIRQMRDRLAPVFRDSDHLVRWGGEEFLIVARGTSRQHAAELAERARAAVACEPFALPEGGKLSKTCSVGFCSFPLCTAWPAALNWEDTLNAADAALYAIKNSGRNGWLGLVDAHATDAASLRAQLAGGPAAWAQGGLIRVQSSGAPTAP